MKSIYMLLMNRNLAQYLFLFEMSTQQVLRTTIY
jgi:hypothetical protein